MAQAARVSKRSQKAYKKERLEARVTPDQKRLIERAASLRGTSVTDFIIVSAQRAAAETLMDFEVLNLRKAAREVFVQAVLNPMPPNAAAKAAAERYKQRIGA